MKKIAMLMAVSTLCAGSAFADDYTVYDKGGNNNDSSSMTVRDRDRDRCPRGCGSDFAWGTAITALTVLGVVVGLTCTQAN